MSGSMRRISWEDLFLLVSRVFTIRGIQKESAQSVAHALLMAESSGAYGHGLSRVPVYAGQIEAGKINRNANIIHEALTPVMHSIDGDEGFAFPCIDKAIDILPKIVADYGLGIVGIHRSNHFGQAGWHCERLAKKGLTAMMFGNAARTMSLWQGTTPLLGTNPIAFACPVSETAEPIVIDVSLSTVARGKILRASQEGKSIPDHWATDSKGKPTTDPQIALDGGLLYPSGGYKGVALAIMVELISLMAGGSLSYDVQDQLGNEGPPPNLGHCLIAFDGERLSKGNAGNQILRFLHLCSQEDSHARLPGISRLQAREKVQQHGFQIEENVYNKIEAIAAKT